MVRSDLSELTYLRSESIITNQKRLLDHIQGHGDHFVTFSQGVFETTIVVSSRLKDTVERIFQSEKQISQLNELSAIVIKLPVQAVSVPGIHYPILKQLAWQGINVIQLVSTFTELTIILNKKQVDLAFSVLLGFLSP
jgi:aspartokinase